MNKDIMRAMGFEAEVKLAEEGKCVFCKLPIQLKDFKDDLSRREYAISGICQMCQDKTFMETL